MMDLMNQGKDKMHSSGLKHFFSPAHDDKWTFRVDEWNFSPARATGRVQFSSDFNLKGQLLRQNC